MKLGDWIESRAELRLKPGLNFVSTNEFHSVSHRPRKSATFGRRIGSRAWPMLLENDHFVFHIPYPSSISTDPEARPEVRKGIPLRSGLPTVRAPPRGCGPKLAGPSRGQPRRARGATSLPGRWAIKLRGGSGACLGPALGRRSAWAGELIDFSRRKSCLCCKPSFMLHHQAPWGCIFRPKAQLSCASRGMERH